MNEGTIIAVAQIIFLFPDVLKFFFFFLKCEKYFLTFIYASGDTDLTLSYISHNTSAG